MGLQRGESEVVQGGQAVKGGLRESRERMPMKEIRTGKMEEGKCLALFPNSSDRHWTVAICLPM